MAISSGGLQYDTIDYDADQWNSDQSIKKDKFTHSSLIQHCTMVSYSNLCRHRWIEFYHFSITTLKNKNFQINKIIWWWNRIEFIPTNWLQFRHHFSGNEDIILFHYTFRDFLPIEEILLRKGVSPCRQEIGNFDDIWVHILKFFILVLHFVIRATYEEEAKTVRKMGFDLSIFPCFSVIYGIFQR